jgi:hypothetical protein
MRTHGEKNGGQKQKGMDVSFHDFFGFAGFWFQIYEAKNRKSRSLSAPALQNTSLLECF